MNTSLQLQLRPARADRSKSKLKQQRNSGFIPGVIYGTQIGNIPFVVEERDFLSQYKKNPHAILNVDIPTIGKQRAIIHEIQKNYANGKLLHIDLHQINMNEKLEATLAIRLVGDARGIKEGGILQFELHELTVSCMPDKLPEAIGIDISELGIGEHLTVADLPAPPDVTFVTEPETVIVTILASQKLDEENANEEENVEENAEAPA